MSNPAAAKLAAPPESLKPPIADVQGGVDERNITIDQVGIKDLRYPLTIEDRSGAQNTVASVSMFVELPPQHKGTHMSRFVEVLHTQCATVAVATLPRVLRALSARLDAPKANLELTFPYFVHKLAPVSAAHSLLDYQVTLRGEIDHERCNSAVKVTVPVTSLCPCSKEISAYGAHNQRSHVTVEVESNPTILLEELIDIVESQASCELYGLLKRADEKFITEKAYDNPKFVEDMARDVAGIFNRDARITRYSVSVENFESIHNHSAYARISRDPVGERAAIPHAES